MKESLLKIIHELLSAGMSITTTQESEHLMLAQSEFADLFESRSIVAFLRRKKRPKRYSDLTDFQLRTLFVLLRRNTEVTNRITVNRHDVQTTRQSIRIEGYGYTILLNNRDGAIDCYDSRENLHFVYDIWEALALLLSWGIDYRPTQGRAANGGSESDDDDDDSAPPSIQWIPVGSSLPDKEVLAISDTRNMMIGEVSIEESTGLYICKGDACYMRYVTHFIPYDALRALLPTVSSAEAADR